MIARLSARWRGLALLSPVSVVLAVGLAAPVESGSVAAAKGDRLPVRCAACTEVVQPVEASTDAGAGVTVLVRESSLLIVGAAATF